MKMMALETDMNIL